MRWVDEKRAPPGFPVIPIAEKKQDTARPMVDRIPQGRIIRAMPLDLENSPYVWLIGPLWMVFVFGPLLWRFSRSGPVLRWAREAGVKLLEYERPWLNRGPFPVGTNKDRAVYRLTVQFPEGHILSGWLRVEIRPPFTGEVEVVWDRAAPAPHGFPVLMVDKTK